MHQEQLEKLLRFLVSQPKETEWLEFKAERCATPAEIGEYVSALANAATLYSKDRAYLVFGVEDLTHQIVGTRFSPNDEKIGQEELMNWLTTKLKPAAQFQFHELTLSDRRKVVITEIMPAIGYPVSFCSMSYIRIGTYKKKLIDHRGVEKQLWDKLNNADFESLIARENVSDDEVLRSLDFPSVFELLQLPLPTNKASMLTKLEELRFVSRKGDLYNITNLGAMLSAKDINEFEHISRKSTRVIVYAGNNKVSQANEKVATRGYAVGFRELIAYIMSQIPTNELIEQALRKQTSMYPEVAVRELAANTLIHQDFAVRGTGPVIEIYSDRIEFSNPGIPLIEPNRFLDQQPRSRNEKLARIMRSFRVCEERGSGIDRVIKYVELFQLPAPIFTQNNGSTKTILYAYKNLREMTKEEKIRAVYQHASLKYISNEQMSNESLRDRFHISADNYPQASRIIKDALESGLIKPYDAVSKSRKYVRYVPYWA